MVIYRSLNQATNEFRLFRIRESVHRDDPIVGDLEYHDLSQPPLFHAISYYCGGPEQHSSVSVNGQHLKVVQNCEEVLQELRARDITLVWVDQICIDQETKDEKSAQILRIASVYSTAKAVIVWLGSHADDSSLLLRQNIESLTLSRLSIEPSIQDQVTAFFLRRYWKRAWIVQEMAAANQLMIWCGDSIVGWNTIERLLDVWLAYRVHPDVKYAGVGYGTLLELYQKGIREQAELYCLRFVRDSRSQGHAFTLLKLLQIFHRSQAGDQRDKVYALLGLAWDGAHFVTEPSYKADLKVPQLCSDMTRACIIRKQSLDVIFFAGARSTAYSLPSWCPNYISLSGHLLATNLTIYLSSQEARTRLGVEGYRWKTTAGSLATPESFSIEKDCLTVQAYNVDSIVALANLEFEEGDHRHDDRDLSRAERLQLMNSMSGAMHMYDRHYMRYPTLPAQPFMVYSPHLRMQDYRRKLAGHNDVVKEWRERHKNFRVCGKAMKDFVSPVGSSQFDIYLDKESYKRGWQNIKRLGRTVFDPKVSFSSMYNLEQMMIALSAMFREGMRLTITEGNRVGWSHPDAQLGDKIFLLAGCTMPAILRPDPAHSGAYTLVGHSYFDGMMDGQLWHENANRMETNRPRVRIF